MTTKAEIAEWVVKGKKAGFTHCIVVVDTFDYEDYPVYVKSGESVKDKVAEYDKDMNRVMEVYDLRLPLQPQLDALMAWNL